MGKQYKEHGNCVCNFLLFKMLDTHRYMDGWMDDRWRDGWMDGQIERDRDTYIDEQI